MRPSSERIFSFSSCLTFCGPSAKPIWKCSVSIQRMSHVAIKASMLFVSVLPNSKPPCETILAASISLGSLWQ
jgi:hypothetical protein